ncbi:MAG: hypothetical protein IJW87_04770 [Clostridia bacterium]|nr:hypothetical protein [Clostridia bacterium]
MKQLSEELWYGNVRPFAQVRVNTPEMEEALKRIKKIREWLCKTLTDEQKEQLLVYDDALGEFHAISENVMFDRGFRFGASVAYADLSDSEK